MKRLFKLLLENKDEYEKMSHACNPYGYGYACERIADILEKYNHWKDEVEYFINLDPILNNLLVNVDVDVDAIRLLFFKCGRMPFIVARRIMHLLKGRYIVNAQIKK